MALVGYQVEREKVEERIREIEAELGGKRASSTSAGRGTKRAGRKRQLSPAARRRIAEAQKKRWAEHRKRVAAGAK
jgi:cell division septum initiation protein DivIVA